MVEEKSTSANKQPILGFVAKEGRVGKEQVCLLITKVLCMCAEKDVRVASCSSRSAATAQHHQEKESRTIRLNC